MALEVRRTTMCDREESLTNAVRRPSNVNKRPEAEVPPSVDTRSSRYLSSVSPCRVSLSLIEYDALNLTPPSPLSPLAAAHSGQVRALSVTLRSRENSMRYTHWDAHTSFTYFNSYRLPFSRHHCRNPARGGSPIRRP